MGGGVIFDIVSTMAAVLFLLTAWAIITGRHDRYYRQFRRQGIPEKKHREWHRITKNGKSE
jgi:uncharacterized membrane protein YbaN (DUF454 family)